jgi:hypothetical protein
MGEISDVVDAILYIESASFVTGEILYVHGGQRYRRRRRGPVCRKTI